MSWTLLVVYAHVDCCLCPNFITSILLKSCLKPDFILRKSATTGRTISYRQVCDEKYLKLVARPARSGPKYVSDKSQTFEPENRSTMATNVVLSVGVGVVVVVIRYAIC